MKNHSKPNQPVNRRRFAGILAGTGAIAPALLGQEPTPPPTARPAPPPQNQPSSAPNPNTSQQRRGTMEEIPPFQETLTFTRSDVSPKVKPFPMTQVRVQGGPYKQAQDWNHGYMQRLSADRLTRNFLVNAGLSSSAKPLGGWEQDNPGRQGELRGHSPATTFRSLVRDPSPIRSVVLGPVLNTVMTTTQKKRIPAYSPQACGRCERSFGTWQNRSVVESAQETCHDPLRDHVSIA